MKTVLTNASQLAEIVRRERRRQKVSQIRLSQLADVGVRFAATTLGIAVELSSMGDGE